MTAEAGPAQSLTLPDNRLTLTGTGTASDGGELAYRWEQLAGPSAAMTGTDKAQLQLSGLNAGEYRFELTVTRGSVRASDTVTVTVADMDLSHLWGGTVSEDRRRELDALVLDSEVTPPDRHPRLYGTDEQWAQRFEVFDHLDPDCQFEGFNKGIGTVNNIKNQWEWLVRGGRRCEGGLPEAPADHREAGVYINSEVDTDSKADRTRRLRILYLIRYLRYCHRSQSGECQFSAEDTQALSEAFIQQEIERLRNAPRVEDEPMWAGAIGYPEDFHFIAYWHRTSRKFFDLGAGPPFKFWTLFLDTFWNEPALSQADKDYVQRELEYEIDSYLHSAEVEHWNLANGNNWTPVLNSAAMHWALLNYHEKPDKAREVLRVALRFNWRHRDYYLDDGAYIEGPSYLGTSLGPTLEMQQLLRAGFDQMLHSFKWFAAGEGTPGWILDNVASDGHFTDFGDAWARRGNASFNAFTLMLEREVLGLEPWGEQSPDACLTQLWFMNSYFDRPFYDPWWVSPAIARDWASIADDCQAVANGGTQRRVFGEYGQGILRQFNPGASEAATEATDLRPFARQADQTFLTVNAVANDIAHRELDFGALIWSAYGNRLLFDFGYGEIVQNYFEYDLIANRTGTVQIDHMLGSNMLVVPSAFESLEGNEGTRHLYAAEAYGARGQVSDETPGGEPAVRVDGSAVLGGSSQEQVHRPAVEGPLRYYERHLVPIEAGNYLVIDAFAARQSQASRIQEFWYTMADDDTSGCSGQFNSFSEDVAVTLSAENVVQLEPECSMVPEAEPARMSARLMGAGMHSGAFTAEVPEFLPEDADFQANNVDQRNGIAVLRMTNRVVDIEERKLIRWVPDDPVEEDVRVFLLQAATETMGGLPSASVARESENCPQEDLCFRVTVGEITDRRVRLTRGDEKNWELVQVN